MCFSTDVRLTANLYSRLGSSTLKNWVTSISSAPSPPILREKFSLGTPLLYASVPLTGAWTSTRMSKVSESQKMHQEPPLTAGNKVDLVGGEQTPELGAGSGTPERLGRGRAKQGSQQEDWGSEHGNKLEGRGI